MLDDLGLHLFELRCGELDRVGVSGCDEMLAVGRERHSHFEPHIEQQQLVGDGSYQLRPRRFRNAARGDQRGDGIERLHSSFCAPGGMG